MTYKKEWTDTERIEVIKKFRKWERNSLVITYGKREANAENTYGLPYTSSSSYALLANTNVIAVLKSCNEYHFEHIAITEAGEIVVICEDENENEKIIIIGRLYHG